MPVEKRLRANVANFTDLGGLLRELRNMNLESTWPVKAQQTAWGSADVLDRCYRSRVLRSPIEWMKSPSHPTHSKMNSILCSCGIPDSEGSWILLGPNTRNPAPSVKRSLFKAIWKVGRKGSSPLILRRSDHRQSIASEVGLWLSRPTCIAIVLSSAGACDSPNRSCLASFRTWAFLSSSRGYR